MNENQVKVKATIIVADKTAGLSFTWSGNFIVNTHGLIVRIYKKPGLLIKIDNKGLACVKISCFELE